MKRQPFYQFQHATQMPTPGAMAYGFESEMMAMRAMIGPGIGVRRQFYTLYPFAQNSQAASLSWLAGLTGVVQGQSQLQPLSNPYGG